MTALLSPDSADMVQAFVGTYGPAAPKLHPLETECVQLRVELERARAALVDQQHISEAAIQDALARGREEGRAVAEACDAERLVVLEKRLEAAGRMFERELEGTEHLAVELAHVALGRLLDDPTAPVQFASSFIKRQVEQLASAGIVRVRISAADFADHVELRDLEARLTEAGARIEIICEPELAAGHARFDLTLGQAEADLRAEWRTLSSLLSDMAQG